MQKFRKVRKVSLFVLADLLVAAMIAPAALTPSSVLAAAVPASVLKNLTIDGFSAHVPVHVFGSETTAPKGLTPDQIKTIYKLPKTGGSGTIAIVTAYDDKALETDLAAFSTKFSLPACTVANKCLEKHQMSATTGQSSDWVIETALDSEWAHAIAPNAKILVVEAASDSGPALLKAIDYARSRPDVVAVSMSWGGDEFKSETANDSHFTAVAGGNPNVTFFAASGDDGTGASWPAASPRVVSVGGTSITLKKDGSLSSEKAWSGSGGGISAYESEPGFQVSYSIAKAKGKRAIPDVAWNADPKSGYSVYHQAATTKTKKGWFVVGGTSAGSPQWAAIRSLGIDAVASSTATTASSTPSGTSFLTKLYEDKASAGNANFFRDITSGTNGDCGYYCTAQKHYDYVTGLGAPITYKF